MPPKKIVPAKVVKGKAKALDKEEKKQAKAVKSIVKGKILGAECLISGMFSHKRESDSGLYANVISHFQHSEPLTSSLESGKPQKKDKKVSRKKKDENAPKKPISPFFCY